MENFITWNGNNVSYQKTGSGPAVLFLHGFGEDHSIWDNQVYPFKAFNIPDEDELKFELHDREKKINLEFTFHGAEYNEEMSKRQ